MNVYMNDDITVDVKDCSRCDEYHTDLCFKPLSNPFDIYSHYATCPNSGQPILLHVMTEDEDLKEALDALYAIWVWTDDDDYCQTKSPTYDGCGNEDCKWCEDNNNVQRILRKYGRL